MNAPGTIILIFDSGITSVDLVCNEMTGSSTQTINVSSSGETTMTYWEDSVSLTSIVNLQSGYVISNVTFSGDAGSVESFTDDTFTLHAGAGGVDGSITITTTQSGGSGTQLTNARMFIKKQSIITNASCITNLVGTTWVFNNSINISLISTYYINFNSNNTDFTRMEFYSSEGVLIYFSGQSGHTAYYDGSVPAPLSVGWQNDNFKTITITGGDDATNSTLISFLWTNATLTSISNVRGKTFILNENFDNMPLDTAAQHNIFFTNSNINGTCNSIQYSKYYDDLEDKTQMYINYYYNGGHYVQPYNLFATNSGWQDQSYRTITILDSENIDPLSRQDYGADSDTVAFFQNYAQLGTLTTILQPVAIVQKVANSGGTITDLTNTTWEFTNVALLSSPVDPPISEYDITGVIIAPNNAQVSFIGMQRGTSGINFIVTEMSYNLEEGAIAGTNVGFYNVSGAQVYTNISTMRQTGTFTINVTGGNDVTNSTAITRFQDYLTQVVQNFKPLAIGYTSEAQAQTEQPSVSLISFTIDNTTYQAEEDMTWYEWVNSEYNIDGYTCSATYDAVRPNASPLIGVFLVRTGVSGSDIISSSDYITRYIGGGTSQ